jgi:7,8-dihydropterin-6-yl-methyl-4-(beta-D-ribofuranosyl)aminobenzene 5'-phosphate synthase
MEEHSLRITIAVDNRAGPGLKTEHGLSLWIEAEGKHILFDTGQGRALKPNAQALGIDLAQTDILVLSHGHFDHTGGIDQVLKASDKVTVFCHAGVMQPRYSIRDAASKAIQIPRKSAAALNRMPEQRIHWVSQPLMLSGKSGITGPILRKTNFEDTGGPFYLDPEARRADPIDDDQALWIQTENGVVVCVGCSHAGLVNTLDFVRRLSGDSRVRAVIGGFHLLNADSRRLAGTLTALQSVNPALVVPCHCTGDRAVVALQDVFGDRVVPGAAGMRWQW